MSKRKCFDCNTVFECNCECNDDRRRGFDTCYCVSCFRKSRLVNVQHATKSRAKCPLLSEEEQFNEMLEYTLDTISGVINSAKDDVKLRNVYKKQ